MYGYLTTNSLGMPTRSPYIFLSLRTVKGVLFSRTLKLLCYDVPYSLTLKSQGFIKKNTQKLCKTTLTYDDQEMQKQCTKKTYNKCSWSKRVHIKKKKMQKEATKNKQNTKQQLKKAKQKRTKRTKNAHAQPNFTHHLFCAMFFHVCASYVRFFWHVFCIFCAFFALFSVFSRKRTKNAKKIANKRKYKAKQMQRQRPERF